MTVTAFQISLVERLPYYSLPTRRNEFNDTDNIIDALDNKLFISKLKKCLLNRIVAICNRFLCHAGILKLELSFALTPYFMNWQSYLLGRKN